MTQTRHISQLHDVALCAALARVFQEGDKERVAQHLGLASAEAAEALLSHPKALFRLSERLADGCGSMEHTVAVRAARSLFAAPTKSLPNEVSDGPGAG